MFDNVFGKFGYARRFLQLKDKSIWYMDVGGWMKNQIFLDINLIGIHVNFWELKINLNIGILGILVIGKLFIWGFA